MKNVQRSACPRALPPDASGRRQEGRLVGVSYEFGVNSRNGLKVSYIPQSSGDSRIA
jgi:hypothetical protein